MAEKLQALGAAAVHDRNALEDNPKRPLLSAKVGWRYRYRGRSHARCIVEIDEDRRLCICLRLSCQRPAPTDRLSIHPSRLSRWPGSPRPPALVRRVSGSGRKLSGDWKVDYPESWVRETKLDDVAAVVEDILQGSIVGRVVVDLA